MGPDPRGGSSFHVLQDRGPGAAVPGLPWSRRLCLLPWKEGESVRPGWGAGGLPHGVLVRAVGGLQPLDLSNRRGSFPWASPKAPSRRVSVR